MSILIQKPGILATVQDLGRQGYRRFGINAGGAMDRHAARLVNISLGNDDKAPLLEMHFPAPQIIFETNTIAAIGGADFAPALDGLPLETWLPFVAAKGSTLTFGAKRSGSRAYLAIRGGFKADQWLGSTSTNLAAKIGGFQGRKLEQGDCIRFASRQKRMSNIRPKRIDRSIIPHYRPFPTVRVIAGAEFENLDERHRELLLDQDYTISNNSDRMGFRLTGQPIELSHSREFVSAAVSFGTVQILPDGQLIVLMADHQTAGGYPRIAHVITHDLPLIAQLGANDKVAFHLIEAEEAERLNLEFEKKLCFLRTACRFETGLW